VRSKTKNQPSPRRGRATPEAAGELPSEHFLQDV
jgi:hypothetical protein